MNRHRHLRRSLRGFTLIELVVALALVGLLAMLAAPLAELSIKRSHEEQLRVALRQIRQALDQYKLAADQGLIERKVGDSGYPPNLEVLASGVRNQKSPKGEMLYFLREVPRDPFAASGDNPASTWELRSYASPPSDPAPGADVFDVHSRVGSVGLNGVPYREW